MPGANATPTPDPSARERDCPECGEGAPGWTVKYGMGEPEQEQCQTCFEAALPDAARDAGVRDEAR